jgi:MoxR-like ATPase
MSEAGNFYEIGKQRKVLRREVLDETGVSARELASRDAMTEEEFSAAVSIGNMETAMDRPVVAEETQEKLGQIKILTEEAKGFHIHDEKQRAAYRTSREASENSSRQETKPRSERDAKKENIFRELDLMNEFLVKQKRGEYLATRHPNNPSLALRLRQNARLEQMLTDRYATLTAHPDTRLIVREHELRSYNRELDTEHFVLTPSRQAYITRIETLINQVKPILLEGHTGTGKSELAYMAAKELTGNDPELIRCNPHTKPSEFWGKMKLTAPDKATITEEAFGALTRAIVEGKICILDEFNELDPRFRQVLKELYNRRPGDMVNIPDNGTVRMAEGFALILTVNLKSDKYKEKPGLEPQEARVFLDSTIRVDYQEPSELYDTALSALSDTEGQMILSPEEAKITLKQFIDAIADIQSAYTKSIPAHYGKDENFSAPGRKKRPALEKYVLDTGMTVRLLQGFHISRMKYGTPLRKFIDESLARTLSHNAVSENDKKLAIFILAKHGFLRDEEMLHSLGLDYSDGYLDPKIFPAIAEKSLDYEKTLSALSTEEVAQLDPYGKRKISVGDASDEFNLPPDTNADIQSLDIETLQKANQQFFFDTFKQWYSEADAQKAKQSARFEKPETLDYQALSQDIDVNKFGEYTLNPDTQTLDFEKAKTIVIELPQFVGQPRWEAIKYIINTYGATHHIPGIEYWKWLIENPDKAPQSLKDSNELYHYFPGSMLRGKNGHWNVPIVGWRGSGFNRYADWLVDDWHARGRVVLIEIEK